ncbi:MAG TPA: hypothetical protein VHL34_06765 [Rhizomicrobium sp.]|jgi:hypothetical protein|nr:hypothetical protein [Rhizomicrobium sp.]
MLSLFNTTRIGLAAGVLALGLTSVASVTPAQASYLERRCSEGSCYRVRCSEDGLTCVRVSSYYDSRYVVRDGDDDTYNDAYYHETPRYLCSSDGELCRWTHTYRDDAMTY